MKVVVVDDDELSLEYMKAILEQIPDISEINTFRKAAEALTWILENKPDIAFLDIEMAEMDGISLAKNITNGCPTCKIIFVTGHQQYAIDAFKLHVSGYILKPASKEEIQDELNHIFNRPVFDKTETKKSVRVQCFGNFEIFVNDIPVKFKNSKTRELVAYLVHRKGATCTVRELGGILLEDISNINYQQSRLRTLVADLMQTLTSLGAEDVVYKAHGCLAILPDKMDCDLYDFIKKDPIAVESYNGEYMAQYEWGEDYIGSLDAAKRKK